MRGRHIGTSPFDQEPPNPFDGPRGFRVRSFDLSPFRSKAVLYVGCGPPVDSRSLRKFRRRRNILQSEPSVVNIRLDTAEKVPRRGLKSGVIKEAPVVIGTARSPVGAGGARASRRSWRRRCPVWIWQAAAVPFR